MINPEQIPQFTGDLAQLELDHAALKKDAGNVRDTGKDVHTQFQGLSAFYTAPEAEQLFATTKPVQDRADDFATHLETVSGALSSYATEIRPLVSKLKELKTKAQTFVNSVKDDDDWEYDGDKVDEHNQLRDDITATVAAFWAAERTCHNKITAIWNGTQMVAGDGSERKDQYGFNAEDLKNAKLPWGDPVDEKHHWYEVGHWVKSFVWDGLIVDGVWGTIKGLGTLVGFGGWDAMGQAWKGLAQLATGLALASIPGVGTAFWLVPDDKLPSWIRDSRTAMKETGKALVAWDEWGKNPGRAAGAVTFNVLTTVFTGGAGGAAAGAGKAGAVAKVLSVAGKAGKVIDPMTYIAKGAGAGLSKIGDIAKGLKGIGKIEVPTLPDGSVHLPDGRLLEPSGNLVSPDGTIDTTPVPHETAPASHQTPSGLPEHWTIQTPDTPAYAGVPHTADNAAYAGAGHSVDNSAYAGAGHTTDGTAHTGAHTPAAHTPSDGIHGGIPQSTPAATASHAASTGAHATSDGIHGGVPHSTGGGGTYTGGAPVSHGIQGGIPHSTGDAVSAGAHSGTTPSAWYHDTPAGGATHDVPTITPHTGGHTPDAPHTPGHDAPNGHPHDTTDGHPHDGADGHPHDGAGHHGDDASHGGDHADAGDHTGLGDDGMDAAAHHDADAPAVPGHGDADVPGHGAAEEPFEYKPLVSDADWDRLTPAEQHRVAYAEISDGTKSFPTDTDAIKYGQTYWNDYAENMPDARRKAVWDYTDEPNYSLPAPHADGWATYKEMNGFLRGDASKWTPYVQHNIDEVDAALAGHPIPEDVMVVRGSGIGHLQLDDPLDMLGHTYTDKGYMSTSLGDHPVPAFASSEAILHLRVPKGTPALWVEKVGKFGMGEREVLLGKGTQYRVTRVFMENGQVQVYGEVLPR
ncbi:ADP-ribosyltransferase [Streptomyces longwoodensis]|uniref:ADP-ribosyltransferase n=2 Tax=Streptomyces longwoodensis TaxID=68231 RepID=UPI0036FFBE7F